jgi:catecholate siderophore receptor
MTGISKFKPQFRKKPAAAAVAMALASPLLASAQQAEKEQTLPEVKVVAPEDTNFKPDTSSVGIKGQPALIRDIPQSVTIINRAVMDSQQATSLADALRNVPGITFGAAENGSIGNNFNIRGFSARTDLYLDGMRDRGQYYRDLFSLDSVEVLKGPSSMLFGRGATGGIVNQVSKVPSLLPSNTVTFTAGTTPSARLTGDFNTPLSDTSAFRLNLMGQDVRSSRDVMENKDVAAAPSLKFGIGTPTEVTITTLFAHYNDMPDYGIPALNRAPAPVNRANYYGLNDASTVQDVASLSALVRHKISTNLTLRNQTQYNSYNIDVNESKANNVGTMTAGGVYNMLPVAVGNAAGNLTTISPGLLWVGIGSSDRTINDNSIYNQTDLIWTFDTWGMKHTLDLGLELGWDSYRNQQRVRTNPSLFPVGGGTAPLLAVVPLLNPYYIPQQYGTVTTMGNLANSDASTIAPYFNDNIDLTEHWKLVFGLRWDRYKASTNNTITLPRASDQTVTYTSVRGGLIYQPTQTQSYYIGYGSSFNPSIETLVVTNGQQQLAPETTKSAEVGAKWDFLNGDLSVTSALFRIQKDNARSQISTGVYTLDGTIVVNGFEIGTVGRIQPNWQILAGYAFLDAEITQASAFDRTQGKTPANTPRNSGTLWTTYNITPEWEVGGGAVYMSQRYANNTNIVSVPNYVRADLTFAFHQPKYDIRLNVLNLFNREKNFDAVIPSDGGRLVPGTNRQALVTYTQRF